MTGYDFVLGVLGITEFEVSPLIALTGGHETEWLEFKSATSPQHGILLPGENEWDYRWGVAEAIVAMANSSGGAVLIGVRETGDFNQPTESVNLEASGFAGDWDEFARKFDDQVLGPRNGWRTGREGHWSFVQTPDRGQFMLKKGTFQGERIAIVLVRQVELNGRPLLLKHAVNNAPERQVLLKRREGDIGKVEAIADYFEISEWWRTRSIDRLELKEHLDVFESEWRKHQLIAEQDAQLELAIAHYAKIAVANIQREFVDSLFTPLDGEERIDLIARALYEQQAEEAWEDYWCGDDYDKTDQRVENVGSNASTNHEQDQDSDDNDNAELLLTEHQPRRGGVFDLLATESRAVLLGNSGSGKSWCLKFLQLQWAQDLRIAGPVTIFLPLSRFRGDLWALCKFESMTPEHVRKLARDGRLTLLLDGLNECPPQYSQACQAQIYGAAYEFPLLCFVLTSRLRHYDGFLGIPVFTVAPMAEDQQAQYLTRYLGDAAHTKSILERLYLQPGGKEMAANPFLLKLVTQVFDQDSEVPLYPIQLHRRFFEQWYRREQIKGQKSGTAIRWDIDFVRVFVSELAYRSRLAGYFAGCDIAWVRSALTEKLGVDSESFLDFIAQGVLFSRNEDPNYLRFLHESIQETLAAEYIADHPTAWKEIAEQQRSWRVVAAHVVTMGSPLDGETLQCLTRIDPWIAACANPYQWDASSLPSIDWSPSSAWFDGPLQLAFSYAMKWPSWSSSAKQYFSGKCKRFKHVTACIEAGLLCGEDFLGAEWDDLIVQWINMNSLDKTAQILTLGLMPLDRRARITRECSLNSAMVLFEKGVITSEDFSEKLKKFVSVATIGQAAMWIESNELLKWDDFADRRKEWIATATQHQAELWVHAGLTTWEEFSARRLEWESLKKLDTKVSSLNYRQPGKYNAVEPTAFPDWNAVEAAYHYEAVVPARVESVNKGGFNVRVCGCCAFMHRRRSGVPSGWNELTGAIVDVVIKKFEKKSTIVVEWSGYHKQLAYVTQACKANSSVRGRVFKIVKNGFGVDCDGIVAIISETDIDRELADRWSSLLEDGELIDEYYDFVVERTVVLDDEHGSMNIRLKFKESEDGVALYLKFKVLADAHKMASIVEGTVTSVKDYGAFVHLKIGVPALLHLKNMSWMKHPKSSDIVSVGDIVQCLVKEVDFASEKVVLDLRSLHPNPFEIAYEQLAAGEIIVGPVRNVRDYGYFVELRPGVEGLLHKSVFSEFLQTNMLNEGDELRVVILSIDSARHRISLGLAE